MTRLCTSREGGALQGLPSIVTWSDGPTFMPSTAGLSLTITRPAAISASISRREP